MFCILASYSEDNEFNWHDAKCPIQDWFIDFNEDSWSDEWHLIMRGVYDDQQYFEDLADSLWLDEKHATNSHLF